MRLLMAVTVFVVFITPAFASGASDEVTITSTDEITGGGGITTSCYKVASIALLTQTKGFDDTFRANPRIATSDGRAMFNEQDGQSLFGLAFVDWTADTATFLKNTVDKCAKGSGSLLRFFKHQSDPSSINMSPSQAKGVIDGIYEVVANTNSVSVEERKAAEEQVRKQNEEQAEALAKAQAEQAAANERAKTNDPQQAVKVAREEYIAKLKSGQIPISSVSDATYYYSTPSFLRLMAAPLLKPDKKYYGGYAVIDRQQSPNVIVAKLENLIDMATNPGYPNKIPIAYVVLKMDSKTKIFNSDAMRVGGGVNVVGKYVSNYDYTTVLGEAKVAPVIQVLYIERTNNIPPMSAIYP